MNERIKELYEQSFEDQPPARGVARLTKDIFWSQPKKFNPEKFAKLLILACSDVAVNCRTGSTAADMMEKHFGVER